MSTKYYIRHVHTYARECTMEKMLMRFCKEKVGFVMSEMRLFRWVQEIREHQAWIKQGAPRMKTVDISINADLFREEGISSIRIGEGYVGLDVVKGEEL